MTEPQKDWPAVVMQRKFPGLPRPVYATEARMDTESERYIPESALLSDEAISAVFKACAWDAHFANDQAQVAFRERIQRGLEAAIKAASEQ